MIVTLLYVFLDFTFILCVLERYVCVCFCYLACVCVFLHVTLLQAAKY